MMDGKEIRGKKRILQVSFDIEVDYATDGVELSDEIAEFLQNNDYHVIGNSFHGDMTSKYGHLC